MLGKLLNFFVYVSIFFLLSSVSRSENLSSDFFDDDYEINYIQKNSAGEKTLDYLLAHHFFEVSHALNSNIVSKAYKIKNLFFNVSDNYAGNINSNFRLFTNNDVNNLFLYKDSHYKFQLPKIVI